MAFHQPTARQSPQRGTTQLRTDERTFRAPSATQTGALEESQTWVLFSPADDATTTSFLSSLHDSQSQQSRSEQSQSQQSQPTPGRSRVSDLGSLNTVARSDPNSIPANSPIRSVFSESIQDADLERELELEDEEVEDADDAELDVLDSHLPEFRAIHPSLSIPVFPSHDGLGSFRLLENTGAAAGLQGDISLLQEHIYAFERYNPRRVKRRRESLDLAQLELEGEQAQELVRLTRVEVWRQEQSQLLLEAIKNETRRRRQSEGVSSSSHPQQQLWRQQTAAAEEAASLGVSAADPAASATHDSSSQRTGVSHGEWHEQDHQLEEKEGVWGRIARKVIRDLMGIDDRMLAILMGEALPEDADLEKVEGRTAENAVAAAAPPSNNSTPKLADVAPKHSDSSWRLRLLERVARELGILVHHMSTHHPGAFATYSRVQQMPLPYAGLPAIPEAVDTPVVDEENAASPAAAAGLASPSSYFGQGKEAPNVDDSVPSMTAQFRPTVPPSFHHNHKFPTTTTTTPESPVAAAHTSTTTTFTQKEWEQDLDIKLVFRYLRSRFAPSYSSSTSAPTSSSSSPTSRSAHQNAAAQEAAAAARAARVRLHHPLVGRSSAPRRTVVHAASPSGVVGGTAAGATAAAATVTAAALHARQRSTSCASQSTRRSGAGAGVAVTGGGAGGAGGGASGLVRRSSVSTSASRHSSRHYWDIGGSVGTGSMIASTGPMGSWGEV